MHTRELRDFLKQFDGELTTHPMRCGGAMAIAASGIPWEELKKMGRWTSDSAPQQYTQGVSAARINRVRSIEQMKVVRQ